MTIKSREEVEGSSIWASLALMVDKAVGRSDHQRKPYQGDEEAKVMVRVHKCYGDGRREVLSPAQMEGF